jgi:uncharacterized membrane protein YbhN (UPF0104 family)
MGEGVETPRAVTLISFQTAEDVLVTWVLVGICLGMGGYGWLDFLWSDPEMFARLQRALRTGSLIAVAMVAGMALLAVIALAGWLGRRARGWVSRLTRWAFEASGHIMSDWLEVFRRGKGFALVSLGLAALQWGVRFSVAGLVLAAFGVEWSPALFWLLQYLVQVISAVIPTPGGMGGAEAAFLLLYAPFVKDPVLIPAMSTWRLLFFYLPLIGAALCYALLRRGARRKRTQRGEAPVIAAREPAE